MRRSNCSAPALHRPIEHSNHSFFQCPALFYHTHFSSDPGAARRGWAQNNLTGALCEALTLFRGGLITSYSGGGCNFAHSY